MTPISVNALMNTFDALNEVERLAIASWIIRGDTRLILAFIDASASIRSFVSLIRQLGQSPF